MPFHMADASRSARTVIVSPSLTPTTLPNRISAAADWHNSSAMLIAETTRIKIASLLLVDGLGALLFLCPRITTNDAALSN